MKIRSAEKCSIKYEVQRDVLSWRIHLLSLKSVLPQSNTKVELNRYQNERASLCAPKKGSLTIETALILPFFLMILLAFFSFFDRYATAARLKVEAAAEARKIGVVQGTMGERDSCDVTIFKSAKVEDLWINPFETEKQVTQHAVCRGWIGFTELGTEEIYVYITPEGSVYHLYSDCTHLKLSIQMVTLRKARFAKNEYGERYRKCELCDEPFGTLVYITSEGNRYHSERSCSGLKRTVRQVALSGVEGRNCCLRCLSREE